MRRLILAICFFILAAAGAAWAVNLCAITGAVELPDGSGCAACTITVNSLVPQTVSSQLINPTVISTTTDSSGNLSNFNVAQGLAVQVTISTASGTTGTPFTVIIPFTSTVTFSNLAIQSNLTGSTTLNNILPPTANVAMAGFTFTGMGCPAGSGQPEVESCTIGSTAPAAGIFKNITAAASGGPFAVSGYNGIMQGVVNPVAYGAVSSSVTTTATCLTGTSACTLAAAGDFANGQAIVIAHGGSSPSLATPVLTVTPSKWSNPFTVASDGAGTTNACYQVEALDGKGGKSAPNVATCTATSEATLSFDAFNRVTWTHVAGATAYKIYSCIGAACTPGFGTVSVNGAIVDDKGAAGTQTWDDGGASVTAQSHYWGSDPIDGNTPNGPQNDNLNTTIVSGAGTTSIVIGTAILNAGGVTTVWFAHDNEPAFAAADAVICTNGGKLYIPAGAYEMGQQWLIQKCIGEAIEGAGSTPLISSTDGAVLLNAGALGMNGINLDSVRNSTFRGFSLLGPQAGFASWGRNINIDNPSHTGSFTTTYNDFNNILLDDGGTGINIGDLGNTNNDFQSFEKVQMFKRGQFFAYVGPGGTNAVGETFDKCADNGTVYGYFEKVGQIQTISNNAFNNSVAVWINTSSRQTNIENSSCEHCARALVKLGATGAAVTVLNNTFIPLQVSTDGYGLAIQSASATTLINNDFSSGQTGNFNVYSNAVFGGAGPANIDILGNIFPDISPFAALAIGRGTELIGNTALVAGVQTMIPDTTTTQHVFQTGNTNDIPLTIRAGNNSPASDLLDTNVNGGATLAFVDKGGHWSQGVVAVPTITAGCNGAGSSVTGSDDAFEVTTTSGGGSTTCTVTFNKAHANAPTCGCDASNSAAAAVSQCWVGTEAVGSVAINFGSVTSGKFNVTCMGH